MDRWPPNVIRTHLETGPRILLSPGAVPAPFYITQNIAMGIGLKKHDCL